MLDFFVEALILDLYLDGGTIFGKKKTKRVLFWPSCDSTGTMLRMCPTCFWLPIFLPLVHLFVLVQFLVTLDPYQ